MLGINSIELNEATMMKIVQYWLDNKFLAAPTDTPKVTAVKANTNYTVVTFTVNLESDTE